MAEQMPLEHDSKMIIYLCNSCPKYTLSKRDSDLHKVVHEVVPDFMNDHGNDTGLDYEIPPEVMHGLEVDVDHPEYQVPGGNPVNLYPDIGEFNAPRNPSSCSLEGYKRVNIFLCYVCDFKALEEEDLFKHDLKHGNEIIEISDEASPPTVDQPSERSEVSCDLKGGNKRNELAKKTSKQWIPLTKCDLCSFATESWEEYSKHWKLHVRGKAFSCCECDFNTELVDVVKQHSKMVHSKERFHLHLECTSTCDKKEESQDSKNLTEKDRRKKAAYVARMKALFGDTDDETAVKEKLKKLSQPSNWEIESRCNDCSTVFKHKITHSMHAAIHGQEVPQCISCARKCEDEVKFCLHIYHVKNV